MNENFKPSKKTTMALAWACELLKQAYANGKTNGGDMDWNDVDLAHQQATSALRAAKREGYRED